MRFSPASALRSLASPWIVAPLLALLTAAAFHPFLDDGFVAYDDPDYVTANPHVRAGLTAATVRWAFTSFDAANWHPLTWLSHAADVELYGLDPRGHHLTSILLHALAVVVLFLALRRMTGSPWRSALVAALFAVHPLRVESVAWVAERKDVLASLFFTLTLWAYAAYAERPSAARYLAVAAALTAGLLSKPMLVTAPFVLLLLDVWPLARTARGASRSRLLLEKLPLVALAGASGIVTVLAQSAGKTVSTLADLPLGERLGNAVVSYVLYLGKLAWPAHLAVLYPFPPGGREPLAVTAAALALAGATAAVVALRRRLPFLAVGWFWYLGMLVPVLGLVQVGSQAIADRYTYLPSIGIFLAVVWGAAALVPRRFRPLLAVAALGAVAAATFQTRAQAPYWAGSIPLFRHAIEVTGDNVVASVDLGQALADAGRLDEAIHCYRRALALKPDLGPARSNLGAALRAQGKLGEAAAELTRAIALDPSLVYAHFNLALTLDDLGRPGQAFSQLLEVLVLEPGFARARQGIASLLAQGLDRGEARARLDAARARHPGSPALAALAEVFERVPPPSVPPSRTPDAPR